MGFTESYLVKLLLYIAIINAIYLPTVLCQEEEDNNQCIPKKVFIALLRLPEASSNLAAYSRTARIIQDAKNRNDMAHLKALSTEENDDSEICIPGSLYLELFRDPAMRAHLMSIGKSSKLPEYPFGRSFEENIEEVEPLAEAEKRSLATLAKNGDLPVSIQERKEESNNNDDEEKRSYASKFGTWTDERLATLLQHMTEDFGKNIPEIIRQYTLPNGELDIEALIRNYPSEKRNVGSLARDFALPPTAGRRNIASLARDRSLLASSGKRNIGALARDRALPPMAGKRNVAALARTYMLPQSGKRDYLSEEMSPIERRYLGSLARSDGLPAFHTSYDEDKRNVASLAKNGDWPEYVKRAYAIPPYGMIVRTMSRHGRSLKEKPLDLYQLTRERHDDGNSGSFLDDRLDFLMRDSDDRRTKRQIDFSDEYPLPVMQNSNVLDYEEMIEALTGQYPNTEKRFMGAESAGLELPTDTSIPVGYLETFQPSKRHIGSLARQGLLPSIRAARFSRSPRYLVDRENSADGPTSNYSSNPTTWSLRPIYGSGPPRIRFLQSLCRYCHHGFRRSRSITDGR
ncbi:neuropeptide-like 1 isoform X1 [Polistes fuscatus]|uniref:neuropeptide-like 1 isoform X1 n=1 Tax=Polistes fuscatus TaxID=30207 RepID=UPI001CA92E8C|nr:neuropeptide-like 1 isoform X1 [Polistes fuscatus]